MSEQKFLSSRDPVVGAALKAASEQVIDHFSRLGSADLQQDESSLVAEASDNDHLWAFRKSADPEGRYDGTFIRANLWVPNQTSVPTVLAGYAKVSNRTITRQEETTQRTEEERYELKDLADRGQEHRLIAISSNQKTRHRRLASDFTRSTFSYENGDIVESIEELCAFLARALGSLAFEPDSATHPVSS